MWKPGGAGAAIKSWRWFGGSGGSEICGVMHGDDLSVTVEKWETSQSKLSALRLKPGPGFPKAVIEVALVYRDRFYEMTLREGVWSLVNDGEPTIVPFTHEKLQPLTYGYNYSSIQAPPEARLREVIPLLQARVLGSDNITPHIPERPLPANQLQLLIAAPAPPGFHMQGQGFGHENGVVLYVQDIFQP